MTPKKKNVTKSSKSPAPATKPAAAKAAPKKKAAPAAALAAAPEPVTTATRVEVAKPALPRFATSVEAPVAPAPVAPPAVVAPAAAKALVTTITANVDVGFGNALFLRGEGAGLSWERGLAMTCVAADKWTLTLPESAAGYTFKLLINDTVWSSGPDYTAACGASVLIAPAF